MNRTAFARVLCLLIVAATAAPLCAQSLADISRKEEDRRKAIKVPSKVYTNKDLGNVPPAPSVEPTPALKADQSKDADKAAEPAKDDDKSKGKTVKDQAYWANRLKGLQSQLERDQDFSDALQSRINALTTDFANRDDPAQRAVIGQTRDKAVAELDHLRLAIQKDKKAVADLQEEARRAGVPPGWLR